ncbi:MAG: hypothetical protein ACI8QD_002836 [Cyclobacteriaceae bacterium]|jgi:hypothetical protein
MYGTHDQMELSLNALSERITQTQQLIDNSSFEQAYEGLIEILVGLQSGSSMSDWQRTARKDTTQANYRSISQLIQQLFGTDTFLLGKDDYLKGLFVRDRWAQTLLIGQPTALDDLCSKIESRCVFLKNNTVRYTSASDMYKYLLLASPQRKQSVTILMMMMQENPKGMYHVALSTWANQWDLSAAARESKSLIARHLLNLTKVCPSIQSLHLVHKCLALTAYHDHKAVAQTKAVFSQLLKNYIEQKNLRSVTKWKTIPLSAPNSKPRLLVLCENFWPGHVVHRCFYELIAPLRESFHVTAVTSIEDAKGTPWDWADETITFQHDTFSLHLLVDQLVKCFADIVLYPSIGLKLWTTILSNLSIAPLQVALPGHPDLQWAKSSAIDYLLTGNKLFRELDDQVTSYDAPGSIYHVPNIQVAPPKTRDVGSPIKVAVVANVFKMQPDYLDTLIKIQERSNQDFQYHILQNLTGMEFTIGKTQLEMYLPNVTVHPTYSLIEYLLQLQSCDLLLGTFPFGGENTILDALSQRLPVVIKSGDRIQERLDQRVLSSIPDFPSVASAHTQQAFIDAAVSLVEQPSALKAYQQFVNQIDLKQIFSAEADMYKNALVDKLHVLYQTSIKL